MKFYFEFIFEIFFSNNLIEFFISGKIRAENFSRNFCSKIFFENFFWKICLDFFSKQKFSVQKFFVKILWTNFVLIVVEVNRE